MAVARDHLARNRLDLEAEFLRDMGFDTRIDVCKCANRARNCTRRDVDPRRVKPPAIPNELGVVASKLEAKCRRLGVDRVAPPDARSKFMLARARLQRDRKAIEIRKVIINSALTDDEKDKVLGELHELGQHKFRS